MEVLGLMSSSNRAPPLLDYNFNPASYEPTLDYSYNTASEEPTLDYSYNPNSKTCKHCGRVLVTVKSRSAHEWQCKKGPPKKRRRWFYSK